MNHYAHPEVLVDTQWLADRLNDPSLRVIEVDMNPNIDLGLTKEVPIHPGLYQISNLISPSSQYSPSNVQKTKKPEQ